jgi:hypothetical protein
MNNIKSRFLGLLFIAPLFSYGLGDSLKESNTPLSTSLIILNSVLVTVLAIWWFPFLSKQSKSVATTYFTSRFFEGLLLLLGLQFSSLFNITYQLAMLILGIGSIILFLFLQRTRILSKIWTTWAIIGYSFLSLGSILELLGIKCGIMMSIPGGLFELSFGLFLLLSRKPFMKTSKTKSVKAAN